MYRIEVVSLVPPIVLGWVDVWDQLVGGSGSGRGGEGEGEERDLRNVKRMISAAAPLSPEAAGALEGKFKKEYGTDVRVLQAWGLTETSPVCTAVPSGEGGRWLSKRGWSVGNLTPNLELRVVDAESGEDSNWDGRHGASMAGELWVRGPNVCLGVL